MRCFMLKRFNLVHFLVFFGRFLSCLSSVNCLCFDIKLFWFNYLPGSSEVFFGVERGRTISFIVLSDMIAYETLNMFAI